MTTCRHPDSHRTVRECIGCGKDFPSCLTCDVGQMLCPECSQVHPCGHLGAERVEDDADGACCARCRYAGSLVHQDAAVPSNQGEP